MEAPGWRLTTEGQSGERGLNQRLLEPSGARPGRSLAEARVCLLPAGAPEFFSECLWTVFPLGSVACGAPTQHALGDHSMATGDWEKQPP